MIRTIQAALSVHENSVINVLLLNCGFGHGERVRLTAQTVAKWWRPDFDMEIYPYVASHITKPKEMIKVFTINLPSSVSFEIPQENLLMATPPFEIFGNTRKYGSIIANLPQTLGRFNYIYYPQ
uniref:DUF2235 domain-containing protein n=1 Tax=Elaeophora elaphi TaxID=1147741 RepID=A0A0R3RY11_9BILA